MVNLVIADPDTLDRIADQADDLATDWDSGNYDYWHIETRDTWLFRTPHQVWAMDMSGGWDGRIYGPHLAFPESLPLIAACDLLGVDEL